MVETVLCLIYFSILLYFGIFVSASFLGIESEKSNYFVLFIFGLFISSLQGISFSLLGYDTSEMIYPLLVHLPLLLFFVFYFKKKVLPSIFAIMSTYLCCQISKWFGIVALTISKKQWFLYLICIAVLIPTWYFIVKYASSSMMLILATSSKTILIFCILPISYYIFDYTTNVYSKLLYSGSPIIFEFLPFILCIAYLAFNILYFKEYEEKRTAKQETQLMELKQTESIKEIEEIRRSAYEISLVRHDMRHFLNNVLFYIESDNTEKATSYIKEVIHATDHTAITKFCDNELVNMILCSYHSKIIKQNITFHATVQISHTLPCSDIDFTSILANALENSIQAVLNLKPEQRTITLDIHMKDTKLLLSLQNPYTKKPEMEYGRPITHESGHGFGTQSIRYVTNKLNGNCQFVAKDGVFTLRIIL